MTTIRVRATVDTTKIEGAAKQIPYALSLAIDAALQKAQAAEIDRMAKAFTIRRKDFLRLNVKLTKRPKKNSLIGEIAIAPPGDAKDIFAKFELGGTKKPIDGRNLAIPVVGSLVKKSDRTIIKPENRPRALLGNAQTVAVRGGKTRDVKRGKRFGGAFIEKPEGGKDGGIFVRLGKKIQLAYLLKPQAKIKPELHFVDTVTRSINQTWETDFAEAFAKAMASRKR